ncbi:MAG: HEAT repeat domain-containing protein, partial [Limnospira sp.]
LLWLGREDIDDSQKEEFIRALVEFEDGCGFFYKYRAYFLAASGIHEFQKCSQALDIVRQIIKYRFGELNCENRRWNDGLLYPTKQELNKIITETIRHFVISELIDVFENCPRERIRTEVIESLSKIDPRNGKATTALVRLMEKTEDEYICRWVAWSLGKVGLGNPQAINTLIQLMEPTEDEGIRRQAVESLGEIGQGNPRAIAALIKFLKNTGDESDQFIAAWSLGEIGQQDPKAIMALLQLINTTRDDDIERLAMWSLGTIGRKNYQAITALFKFLQPNQDEYTRCLAAEVLGKQIESNKKQAIDTLIELAQTTKNKCFIWNNVIPALAEIGNDNAKIVAILIEFIETSKNQMIRIYAILKLEKISRNCHEAITILSRILESEKDENICKAAVYVLGEISHHNIRAINVLIQLFRMTQDKGMREMVIDSLSKIGQGNSKVIDNFIQILEVTEDEDICCDIAVSLGEIGRENPKAINALTKFLAIAEDKYTRSTVALSLGKIDPGNILAINTLLEIIKINDSREVYSFCVAENFKLLLTQKKEFADVVSALRDPLNDEIENNNTQHKNFYSIVWHCAQNLPYPDFYRAWHGDEATVLPELEAQFSDRTQHPSILDIDATILDGETETNAIAATLCELIFEVAFPDEEIPEFENAPQLRKHLKTLKKRLQQPQLAILLRHCEPTSELIQFCRRLTSVIHIAWITDTRLEPPLQSIPTNHPNPQEAVLAWQSEHSN